LAFPNSGRATGNPKEVYRECGDVGPKAEEQQRDVAPGKPKLKEGRKKKACEPQKGMFRSRERGTASGR